MESYSIKDIIMINKDTYFQDVYLFVKHIKNVVTMGDPEKVHTVIFSYLHGTAL